jgi:NADH-quinone oxidoreductase subunit D
MAKTATTQTQLMEINLGPQHPATHGVLRMVLTLDGERVIKVVPHIGYLHRGIEKLAENLEYFQITPLLDRLDYVANINNELSYVMAVEKLAGIRVPERAEYIRVIMAEFNRIMSHIVWFGPFTNDIGLFGTGFLYAMRDREYIQRLFEKVTGGRMHYNYLTPGGLRSDVPDGFVEEANTLLDRIPKMVDEYEFLVEENEIFRLRTKGVGILDKNVAFAYGISGPILRACGIPVDLRKDEPYSIYKRFDFEVVTAKGGDNFARFKVRMDEIRESVKIIRQALESLPAGPVKGKIQRHVKPPAGEVYVRTEHPKGEFGVYIVCDGTTNPYRVKFRSPSYCNLMGAATALPGLVLADLISTMASMDIVMGCIDR